MKKIILKPKNLAKRCLLFVPVRIPDVISLKLILYEYFTLIPIEVLKDILPNKVPPYPHDLSFIIHISPFNILINHF